MPSNNIWPISCVFSVHWGTFMIETAELDFYLCDQVQGMQPEQRCIFFCRTFASPRAVCSGYISMHRRTHHQSDVTRIMCVVQGHSVVSHHFVFISHIEHSVGLSPWCLAQWCPNVQCPKLDQVNSANLLSMLWSWAIFGEELFCGGDEKWINYRAVLVGNWCYWVSMGRYWL